MWMVWHTTSKWWSRWYSTLNSVCRVRMNQIKLHLNDLHNDLRSYRGLHCHLCHRAWKQLKRERDKSKWKCRVKTYYFWNEGKWALTLQLVPGLPILQKGEVTWNILQKDFLYGRDRGRAKGMDEYSNYHICTNRALQSCGDKLMHAK